MIGQSNKELELLQALRQFKTRIVIDGGGIGCDLFAATLTRHPEIAYYVSKMSASAVTVGPRTRVTFDVAYHNTQVPFRDIYVVSGEEEVHALLDRYLGDYKSRLVIFAGGRVNVENAYRAFSDGRAAFYPNFTSATISTGSFSSVPYRFFDFCFQYRIGRVKLQMMEMAVDNEVERLARQMFLPGMSEATKAFLAHNHLAHTIRYTLLENASNLDSSYIQSAYGALIEKKCVCQGYAEAFKRLMDYAGITCDVVCGQTKGSDTYHAWNILRLNGGTECYHVDVTWDSSDGRVSYNYFGLRDADFAGERTWNRRLNAVCASPKSLLVEARREIPRFKARLMANGVSTKLLGY